MTNQNPASSQSQPSLDRDILAKLSAHADRSLDRLFTDIDELLSGDLEPDVKSAPVNRGAISQSHYNTESFQSAQNPHRETPSTYTAEFVDRSAPRLTAKLDSQPSAPAKPKPKQTIPLWLKALLGLGVTSIALSSLLFWLVTQRKVAIPQSIDTSWLPFQSQSQVSPADAKFADYMRKSISKIESTANIPVTAVPNNPANPIAIPIQATPINPAAGIIPTATKAATQKPISLVKTLKPAPDSVPASKKGQHQTAIFQIDGKSQTIKIGQKIGTSNWSLVNVSKADVTIKDKGGEIRSIKIGQKF